MSVEHKYTLTASLVQRLKKNGRKEEREVIKKVEERDEIMLNEASTQGEREGGREGGRRINRAGSKRQKERRKAERVGSTSYNKK
jgi:hypothetical protein